MNNSIKGNFTVGTMVVGTGLITSSYLNGCDGIVLEDLGVGERSYEITPDDSFTAHAYVVEWANGEICEILKENLRAKKPPTKDDRTLTGEDVVMSMFKECEGVV